MAAARFTVWLKDKATRDILIRVHQGVDQSEATQAAREIYPNPVAAQNVTVDPRRTVGGFENDPQDGTYTEIAWVKLSDDTGVRLV